MAEDKIALKIEIEADRAQMSLGDLEKGFDGLREKLKATNRGTEEGRKQFAELSTQMAQTSKEIKNIELGFEGLDKEQVASELGSVSGAIGDVTASLILMGGESETMEQVGASIQNAMAISMGFKGAIEGLSSAKKLYNNLLKQGKIAVIAKSIAEKAAAAGTWLLNTANKALNTTLKLNPIGLIVTAIGLAVTAIVYFKDSIVGLIDTALKPFQWAIDTVVDALQWLGIMESDSAIATREAEEAKSKAATESARKRVEETEKLIAANKKMTDSVTADMDWEIRKRKANGEDTTEIEIEKLEHLVLAAKEEQKLQKSRREDLIKEMKVRIETGDVTIAMAGAVMGKLGELAAEEEKSRAQQLQGEQDLELALIALKKSKADKSKEIRDKATEDNAAAAETEKAAAEKDAEDAKILAAELLRTLDDLEAKAHEDKNLRAVTEKELAHTREKEALILKHGENAELLAALDAAQKLEMDELIFGIEEEAKEKKIASDLALAEIEDKKTEDALNRISKEAAARTAAAQEGLAMAADIGNSLLKLNADVLKNQLANDNLSDKEKLKLQKAAFERNKKLQIGMAIISGAQAVLSALATPPFPVGLAMAAVAGVSTAVNIATIKKSKFDGGGSVAPPPPAPVEPRGAGEAGAGAAINPVTNTSTILGNQQVTVTETDITNTQNNVSVIEESATF